MIVSGDMADENSVKYHVIKSISEEKIKFRELKENAVKKDFKNFNFSQKIEETKKNHEIYEGCDDNKTCFGIPSGCVGSGSCSSIISVQKSSSKLF